MKTLLSVLILASASFVSVEAFALDCSAASQKGSPVVRQRCAEAGRTMQGTIVTPQKKK